MYAAAAGALATLAALPVALLSVRHPSRITTLLERSTLLVLAMPGIVIALAVSYFVERYASGLPLPDPGVARRRVRDPVLPARAGRGQGIGGARARSARRRRTVARPAARSVLVRVTVPLLAPGLAAGFCLVFLSVVTELTATLILIPTGVRPSRRSSGPTNRTCPTAKPHPSRC